MNTITKNGKNMFNFIGFLAMIVFEAVILTGCANTNVCGIQQLNEILAYQSQDLRQLKQAERERIALIIDHMRGVEFWPAFVCNMRSAWSNSYVAYVESPAIPEANPPQGLLRISLFEEGWCLTSSELRSFNSLGVLRETHVVRDHQIKYLGDLLVFTVQVRMCSPSREIYALSSANGLIHPVLVRVEDEEGHAIRVRHSTYFSQGANVAIKYCVDTDWQELMVPERLPDLLAALVYITSRIDLDDARFSAENGIIEKSIFNLKTSGKLEKLLKYDNEWVREYAHFIAGGD